jgi:hypothetical protein
VTGTVAVTVADASAQSLSKETTVTVAPASAGRTAVKARPYSSCRRYRAGPGLLRPFTMAILTDAWESMPATRRADRTATALSNGAHPWHREPRGAVEVSGRELGNTARYLTVGGPPAITLMEFMLKGLPSRTGRAGHESPTT